MDGGGEHPDETAQHKAEERDQQGPKEGEGADENLLDIGTQEGSTPSGRNPTSGM